MAEVQDLALDPVDLMAVPLAHPPAWPGPPAGPVCPPDPIPTQRVSPQLAEGKLGALFQTSVKCSKGLLPAWIPGGSHSHLSGLSHQFPSQPRMALAKLGLQLLQEMPQERGSKAMLNSREAHPQPLPHPPGGAMGWGRSAGPAPPKPSLAGADPWLSSGYPGPALCSPSG